MKKVVLDPGHGGPDPGAIGPTGVQEKVITLAIAKEVADLLKPVVEVKLTRVDDRALAGTVSADLSARAAMANTWAADCFVSIHCNSATNREAAGTEVFCFTLGGQGERLAKVIHGKLIPALGLPDRGVKTANFAVLRQTKMPACLVELAFISNPTEEALLESPDFQEKAARAIAQGIADFLEVQLRPGFEQTPAPADPPAKDTVKVVAGNKAIEGVLINGTTYAPVRDLAQALGKKVRWVQEQKTVVVE
jgi:N-acetylmuramoyl-L-alanine amidase